ncbi:phosphate ABC transporter substrate-binding protein [Synechococcus sp. Nb3U1]|uniref:phosphate ABC transporter substrate-binding protein n=1 Tax=Synechococcus sp. Nb3U1 TaxID=1914529 RepID=UPI001F191814|nr:phosphate ABC transporter substrate-binding protein [Synechococcus sp. Nb3U1]MCF2970013.1 phosphate ABC transporter substrate-binding protein [Synechococcus sp. Nb3U1]
MTAQRSGPPPIVYILLLGLLGGGGWYAYSSGLLNAQLNPSKTESTPTQAGIPATQPTQLQKTTPTQPQAQVPNAPANPINLDTSLPNPAVIQMDGSVTMVRIVLALRAGYTQRNPSIPITYGIPDGKPNGSNAGMQALMNGQIQLAATSRPLNATEVQAGIQAIPIAKDALAVAVSINNPYKGGLTLQQLADIFQGRITNWSQVGGPNRPIRVLNRARQSGTYTVFQDLVLLGLSFAPDGPNFTTASEDATTPLLRALGEDGITYSTVDQVENQQTVRIVPIDGQMPTREAIQRGSYPLSRSVFLAVPQQTSPAVANFINYAASDAGQQIISRTEFIPLR